MSTERMLAVHFRSGDLYEILRIAKDHRNNEQLVVYTKADDNAETYVDSYDSFFSRFRSLSEEHVVPYESVPITKSLSDSLKCLYCGMQVQVRKDEDGDRRTWCPSCHAVGPAYSGIGTAEAVHAELNRMVFGDEVVALRGELHRLQKANKNLHQLLLQKEQEDVERQLFRG